MANVCQLSDRNFLSVAEPFTRLVWLASSKSLSIEQSPKSTVSIRSPEIANLTDLLVRLNGLFLDTLKLEPMTTTTPEAPRYFASRSMTINDFPDIRLVVYLSPDPEKLDTAVLSIGVSLPPIPRSAQNARGLAPSASAQIRANYVHRMLALQERSRVYTGIISQFTATVTAELKGQLAAYKA